MIDVVKLIKYCEQVLKQGTAGFTTQDEKNNIIYVVQYEILSILCDNYENNQKVSDALVNHVVTVDLATTEDGIIEISEDIVDYYRLLSVLYDGLHKSTKIGTNEKAMYLTSPIRKPDLNKNLTVYYMANGNINMLPSQALNVEVIYCKKPEEALIVYESISGDEDDYLVVDEDETVNLEFPEALFNLFAYSILEKLGIETKESLALEYSNLGIQRTIKSDITN